ncbi:HTH_Tnp_Tc3_2 domain-containing protein [Trichonephila clavipes]|nr:HTH_Tnp_Tc3_2 domain-containing protein [Trichonephila clavipes]
MPLRRNRRQYEQLTDFDRGRIIGLREAGWSNRRIGRHLGRSDMVVCSVLATVDYRRQCRLDFCRPRAAWSVTDWRRVIFSDESRFSLSADDHRTRVWRHTGQRSDPAFIVERHTAISQGVIYQQDNARPHTARLSPNNVFKDMTSYHGLPGHQIFRQYSMSGKATAAVPRNRRINCADARLWQDLPQGATIPRPSDEFENRIDLTCICSSERLVLSGTRARTQETLFTSPLPITTRNSSCWRVLPEGKEGNLPEPVTGLTSTR